MDGLSVSVIWSVLISAYWLCLGDIEGVDPNPAGKSYLPV